MTQETDRDGNPGVRMPPPLAVAVALGLGLGLEAIWPAPLAIGSLAAPEGLALALGAGLVLGGLGLILAAGWRFKRAGTAIEPWKPASVLIERGPYRLTRNPIYLSFLVCLAGIGLIVGSLWVLAMLLPIWVYLRFAVIGREERYLEARFGEDYRAYRQRVRRWL